jgi:MarR family transcriptional regulator, organic hydroperoxide resistance regulator
LASEHPDLEKVATLLRLYGASNVRLTRGFAESLNLHPTDAAALSEIIYAEDRGNPISPANLARHLSLSKPALTACINRLEQHGYVVRCREKVDRRVLTLRCGKEVYQHVGIYFEPLSQRMNSLISSLPQQDIDLIKKFLLDASNAIALHVEDSIIE